MAEPGFLYKVTDTTVEEGVIGRRCVRWPDIPPPIDVDGGDEDDPPTTNPPDEDDDRPTKCPEMRTEYVWADGGCYAIRSPVDASISGWPASCGGNSYKVEDSKCGR